MLSINSQKHVPLEPTVDIIDKIKVLHIIDSGGMYGAEVMLLNLIQEQTKLGLEAVICSIGEPGAGEKPLEAEARKRGIKVKEFRCSRFNIFGIFRILKYAKEENFQLLHTHGYKGDIQFGLIPERLRNIPIVATLHGWTSAGSSSKMRIYEWLDARSLKHIDAVVAVSGAMLSSLKNRKKIKLHIVNNGLPPLDFSAESGQPDKKILLDSGIIDFCNDGYVVGAIGRLSPEKGFNYLIETIHKINDSSIKLVIIGDGPERENLERLIDKFGIKGRILLPGYMPEAFKYLPLFNVFVLPSITEGLPITLLEAMQAGIPIIATSVGGVPETLDDGEAGIIVEPGDSKPLEKAIRLLYKDKEHARRLAGKAKEIAKTRYSSREMALGYYKIYKFLQLSSRKGSKN